MWNKYQSFRLPVNSHHVCQSPMWNCTLWGIWFLCCSCIQEMTCGSDTVRLLEQMLFSSQREVLVCCPSSDSCLGNKFEDTSFKGRAKSLLAWRHGVLWQFWHPSVLPCDQSVDLCTHSGAPTCVEAPRACPPFSLQHASACNVRSKGFPFLLQTPLTEQNVSCCALYIFILRGKNACIKPVFT